MLARAIVSSGLFVGASATDLSWKALRSRIHCKQIRPGGGADDGRGPWSGTLNLGAREGRADRGEGHRPFVGAKRSKNGDTPPELRAAARGSPTRA